MDNDASIRRGTYQQIPLPVIVCILHLALMNYCLPFIREKIFGFEGKLK